MAIQGIFDGIYKVRNFSINSLVYWKNIQRDKTLRAWMEKNREFKDIHKGERCFILGNGPSLKTENLDLLQGEILFTVNQINRLPDYKRIKSKYHFWVDGNFFHLDTAKPEDAELLHIMGSIGKEEPICFFPLEQKSFCEKHGLMEKLNIRFFAHKYRLMLHEGYDTEIDFTKYLPGYGTVVQYCISMAIYMGFSEIYLLGCDNTGIMVTLKSAMKANDESDYAYSATENEKKRMERLLERNTVEDYAIAYAQTLTAYRRLYEYCQKRNISLINCSGSTVIDSIPRKKLADVVGLENQNENIK